MKDKVVITFNPGHKKDSVDLEVSLDITANDLIIALNQVFNLGFDISKIQSCYLKSENPIALLKGNRTLRDIGIIDGTIISR